jgi:ABC-type multidrug transport system permease subunit
VKDDECRSRQSSLSTPVVYETEGTDADSHRSISLADLQRDQFNRQSSQMTQLKYLCEREGRGVIRNKLGLVFKFLTAGLLNLLFSLIFLGAGGRDETGNDAQLNIGTHFGAVTQLAVSACFSATQPISLTFPLERPVFLREYATGTYSALPYMLSKLMVELPITFCQQCVVFIVAYWLMELQGNWFFLVLCQTLLCIAAASSALVVGCATANPQNVSQLVPLVVVPQILFTGFFIRISQIPVWLRWAQYLCSLKFSLNLILLVEFSDCEDQQLCDEFVLDPNNVVEDDWWIYVLILVGIFVGFRLWALQLLVSKAKNFE